MWSNVIACAGTAVVWFVGGHVAFCCETCVHVEECIGQVAIGRLHVLCLKRTPITFGRVNAQWANSFLISELSISLDPVLMVRDVAEVGSGVLPTLVISLLSAMKIRS